MHPSRFERAIVSLPLVVFSVSILYIIGFAHSTTHHKAAPDVRHAFAFPCH